MAGIRQAVQQVLGRNILAAALNLVSGVIVARALGPHDRGLLAVVIAGVSISTVVCACGSNVAIRHILPGLAPNNRSTTYLSYLILTASLALLQATSILAVCQLAGDMLGSAEITFPVVLAASIFGAAFLTSTNLIDLLNAEGRLALGASINITGSFLQVSVVFALLQLNRVSLELVIASFAAAFTLQSIVAFEAQRRARAHTSPSWRALRTEAARILRVGAPAIGLNLGQVIAYRIDRLLLGIISGPTQAGLYAVASTPAEAIRMPSVALSQVLMHRGASEGKAGVKYLWRTIIRLVGLVAIPGLLIAVSAPLLIPVVFGAEYTDSVPMLWILVAAELALIPFQVLGRLLSAFGETRASGALGGLGALVALGCLPPLIYLFEGMGAALGTLVAYSCMSLMAIYTTRKKILS